MGPELAVDPVATGPAGEDAQGDERRHRGPQPAAGRSHANRRHGRCGFIAPERPELLDVPPEPRHPFGHGVEDQSNAERFSEQHLVQAAVVVGHGHARPGVRVVPADDRRTGVLVELRVGLLPHRRGEGDLACILVGLSSRKRRVDARHVVDGAAQKDASHLPGPRGVDVVGDDLEDAGLNQRDAGHVRGPRSSSGVGKSTSASCGQVGDLRPGLFELASQRAAGTLLRGSWNGG